MKVAGYEIKLGADLFGANLPIASLQGENLPGAFADEGTRWPEGFDPVDAGVTFI